MPMNPLSDTSSSLFKQIRSINLAHDIPSSSFSTFYAACQAGDLEQVQSCYEQKHQIVWPEGQGPMHIAVQKEYLEIVQWLHKKDSSLIDQPDNNQLTPLQQAAFHEAISILKLFEEKLKNDAALIEKIAKENCPKSLVFLLEQGVDPNNSNASGQLSCI